MLTVIEVELGWRALAAIVVIAVLLCVAFTDVK